MVGWSLASELQVEAARITRSAAVRSRRSPRTLPATTRRSPRSTSIRNARCRRHWCERSSRRASRRPRAQAGLDLHELLREQRAPVSKEDRDDRNREGPARNIHQRRSGECQPAYWINRGTIPPTCRTSSRYATELMPKCYARAPNSLATVCIGRTRRVDSGSRMKPCAR